MVDGFMVHSFSNDSFTVIMCVAGKLDVGYELGSMTIRMGQTLLLPANLNSVTLSGKGVLLTAQS